MKYIDLHVHSNASDGTYTPTQLVEYALQKQLSAFALTDHDTVNGIKEATIAASSCPVTIIPGVELSTDYHNKEIHILGLFIDYTSHALINQLNEQNNLRIQRNVLMCDLLAKEGFDISMQQINEKFGKTVVTRAHFARYLLDKGYVLSMAEGFDKYLDKGRPCYVAKQKNNPQEAIELILNAGGFPILAHPLLYRFSKDELKELIVSLKQYGLVGIEAIYSLNEGKDEQDMLSLARQFDLKITGGSDFHGSNKPSIDLGVGKGNLRIPFSLLDQF